MQTRWWQLQSVAALQRRLLPFTLPQPDGWRLAVHYSVGKWPGGDYYDFLTLPDGRVLLVVADASDQGAPSSVLVALTRSTLHSCPLSSGVERLPFCPLQGSVVQPPHVLLGHLNRVLFENSLEEQSLTAFCAVLDPVDGNLHFANAGHPAPRWWRAARGEVQPLRDVVGLPLGLDGHASYHRKRIAVETGDMLVFYSDGLTAALDEHGQSFGCDRLDDLIATTARHGADAVLAAVVASFEGFLDNGTPEDDVTLVVLERLG